MNAANGPGSACRLLVIGPTSDLSLFDRKEKWPVEFTAVELLETWPSRRSWQFEAVKPPLSHLRALSIRWPFLMFFLDYETGRVKGLASFRNGRVRHYRVAYP